MENACDNMMSMFPEADVLMVEKFVDETEEIVVVSPMRMSDGYIWHNMALVTGLEEVTKSKYGIMLPEEGNDALRDRITAILGKKPVEKII